MDIAELKQRVILLREMLRDRNVHLDGAILFGSRAKGTHRTDSDFDLAVISRDFGNDRHEESVLLNELLFLCIPNSEGVPVGIEDYLDPQPLSPILWEIKKHGIFLI